MEAYLHHVSILEDMYLDCPIKYSYVVTSEISGGIVYATHHDEYHGKLSIIYCPIST